MQCTSVDIHPSLALPPAQLLLEVMLWNVVSCKRPSQQKLTVSQQLFQAQEIEVLLRHQRNTERIRIERKRSLRCT